MPDEVGTPARSQLSDEKKPTIHDAVDALAQFVLAYPAWTDKTGYPLSWRHFIVGIRRLTKARAQYSLDMYRAMAIAQAKVEDRKPWVDEQESLAGYRNG